MIGAMYCANSICAFDLFAPVAPVSLLSSQRRHLQVGKKNLSSRRVSPPTNWKSIPRRPLARSPPPRSARSRLRKSPTSRVDGSPRPLARRRPSPHLGRARRPTSRESGVPSPGRSRRFRGHVGARTRAGRFHDLTFIVLDGGVGDASSVTTVRARRGSDQIDIIHYSSKDKYLFAERFDGSIGLAFRAERWRAREREDESLFCLINLSFNSKLCAFRLFRASPPLVKSRLSSSGIAREPLVLARTRLR